MFGEHRTETGAVVILRTAYSNRHLDFPTPGLPEITTIAFSLIAVLQACCTCIQARVSTKTFW